MKEIFEKKLQELKALGPVRAEAKRWLEDSNIWMSLYTLLCLRSIRLDKKTLVDILGGKIMEDINIELYGFCFRFRDVYKDMVSCVEMQASLSSKLMDRWYELLFEPIDRPLRRRDNSVVYDIGFIPCHYSEVSERMEKLLHGLSSRVSDAEAAADFQLKFISIYPYGKSSVSMAFLGAMYIMLKAGIPLPSYPLNEDDYCRLVSLSINEGDDSGFIQMHYRSLVNRLETVISVYGQAKEE